MGRSVLFSSYKSVSFKEIVPLSGDVNPAILLRMLDFPAPDGPERTTISLFTCSVARNKKCGNCFSISTNNIVILLLTIAYFFCRSEEHTSELQSRFDLVCRLLLEKKKLSRCFFLCFMTLHN